MKRNLVAVSLAVLAIPAFAADVSAPYEETQVDRALPNVQVKGESSKKSNSTETNPWANDYNFIAPAL
jgi:opacity protein-like surface antigen